MLQGTLDVFSLDEVLGLLAGARKTGVLNITGDRGVGTVAISEGLLVAGSASSAPGVDGLSEAVFELLRFAEGSFSFDGDAGAEGDGVELETVLAEAHARLGEWREIEAVVPTLDHHLTLVDSLATSQVTLNEAEWSTIVAIGEGATVGVVADRLDLGEFDGSKRVKGLVERSLATISATPPAAPVDLPVAASPVEEPPAFEAPVFETPAPEPTTFDVPMSEPTAEAAATIEEPSTVDIASDAGEVGVGDVAADAIPPMPDVPSIETSDLDETSREGAIPPMPEPPHHIDDEAAIAGEFAAPIESEGVESLPADDDSTGSFGGLDPISSVDMFEPPQRAADRPNDGFVIADDVPPAPEADAASESAPETTGDIPSLAPPAFDPDAYAVNREGADDDSTNVDDSTDVAADPFATAATESDEPAEPTAETDDAEQEKGGSLLMRYLKSHG